MTDFNDYFLSEHYLKPYCLMNGIKGFVFVEGLKDISFWRGVIERINGENYSITYASKDGTRGKTVLKSHLSKASQFAIFALDSDFDYVCPNNSIYSKEINENPFIFQTLTYSKESVCLHHSVIEKCLSDIRVTDPIEFPVKSYLSDYSSIIYDALVLFLFRKEQGIILNDDEFHKKIKPDAPSIGANYSLTNDPFGVIRLNITNTQEDYKYQEEDELDFLEYKKGLIDKGLTNETAVYFINGHFFEDSIAMPLIKALVSEFKITEFNKVKEECGLKKQLISDRKKELFEYIDNVISFESLVQINTEKYSTPFALNIINNHG